MPFPQWWQVKFLRYELWSGLAIAAAMALFLERFASSWLDKLIGADRAREMRPVMKWHGLVYVRSEKCGGAVVARTG